ncbi:MAG TPA: amino acid adenylation domain-containing protein, partial [Thermoanaerobaculia bacterium]|nr:amino acid adenylation domain-containing protein [Thermoanaerobaculia bacterium]
MSRARAVENLYPLSPMQKGLLFHTIGSPDSGLYITQSVYELRGEVERQALARALQSVLDRHSVLRTAFHWERRDEPFQVVYKEARVPLQELDWREVLPAELERRQQDFLRQDRQHGFDIARPPLLRVALIRLTESSWRLVWSHHHLLLDGWSLPLLFNEFAAFYEAFRQQRELQLPRPRPFANYIAWLQGQDLSQAETFWRHLFQGFSPSADGLEGRVLPSAPEEDGERAGEAAVERGHLFGTEETERLAAFCRQHQLTLNTLILGAWSLLLGRVSGSDDVVFGVTVSGRPPELEGVETMVGVFINTLPLRVVMPGQQQVLPWLTRLQLQQVELRRFEHTPLVDIQRWSRIPANQPLFDKFVVFENYPGDRRSSAGQVSLQSEQVSTVITTNYPLGLIVGPAGRLLLKLVYHAARYDDVAILRLLEHLRALLEGLVSRPLQLLMDVPWLTPAEAHQLRTEWTEMHPASLPVSSIPAAFEQWAERTPQATALVCAGEERTYGDLNRAANRLAWHLLRHGAGAGVRVGICVERSIAMIVGLLGILKTGAAYVPLDPANPAERLEYMLADSGARLLVVRGAWPGGEPAASVTLVDLDGLNLDREDNEDGEDPKIEISSGSLAYVIYTSGSTGRPKGVLMTQANVLRLFASTRERFGYGSADVWTLFHSYAFDFSVWEIWGALLHGGRLVVVPFAVSRSPESFHALLRQQGVTILSQTPSAFYQLIWVESILREREGSAPALPRLRLVVFGGEALDFAQLAPWIEHHGDRQPELNNMYGITETTVHCMQRRIHRGDLPTGRSVIGRPHPDMSIHVVTPGSALVPLPVPIGVPGEIWVGGGGLAMGYLGRPALTAERFIPDPFGTEPGGRLYRSGDLARHLDSGDIQYLGRIDFQVQIRGFRVELGEIETALHLHTAVLQSVVLAHGGGRAAGTGTRLSAYIVLRTGGPLTAADLRAYLASRLPEHMVPSRFFFLESLPLTNSGKVDRQALALLEGEDGDGEEAVHQEPRTPVEELLAALWSEVLETRVGIHDDFFESGGHSLLAMRLISRVRASFQVELPLRALMEHPTVAGLARELEDAKRREMGVSAPPIERTALDEPPPLSFAQQRLWFIQQMEPESSAYNLATPWRVRGLLEVDVLARSLREIVRRHEVLRTTFESRQGGTVQIVHTVDLRFLALIDLSALPAPRRWAESSRLTRAEARRPFDMERGPLLRTALLRLEPEEHVVLFTMHHVITDGWSADLLIKELKALYGAFLAGRPSPLDELPVQYADFAVWQRSWLQGEVLDSQLAYWRRRLGDDPEPLDLPADRPRPLVRSDRGGVFELVLDEAAALAGLAQRERVTLFMTLLPAFQICLHRLTQQRTLNVGTPVSGRHHRQLEDLIGFFANILVLRSDTADGLGFRQHLLQAKETTLEAYAHQDLPFEKLVDELKIERDLRRSPLFQVVFTLQNAGGEELRFPGLELSPWESGSEVSLFDLTLTVMQRPGGLVGSLAFSRDLFDTATIARL